MSHLEVFQKYRSDLTALAYRMMGTVSEAEDVVQEVFIKWRLQPLENIEKPKNWLMRICTNMCLDHLRKAYKKREVYTGPWLPEPVLGTESTQQDKLEMAESLNMAFLLLLEKLKPVERAVYLLHDIFGYKFSEVSDLVGRSETNCRKIAERSRSYIRENKPRFDAFSEDDLPILQSFFESIKSGDQQMVMDHFSQHPEFWSDGGGKAIAARKVLTDANQIAKFFTNVFKQASDRIFRLEFNRVNGKPGAIIYSEHPGFGWKLETIYSFETVNGKIARIYAVRNPDRFSTVKASK